MDQHRIPDDIEQSLARNRAALAHDVQSLVREVRTLADWRHHFRAHRWLYCSGAAAVGFMLVPRRSRTVNETVVCADSGDIHKVVEQPGGAAPIVSKLLQTAISFAVTTAIRETASYLSHRVRPDPPIGISGRSVTGI